MSTFMVNSTVTFGDSDVESDLRSEIQLQVKELENLFLTEDLQQAQEELVSRERELSNLQATQGLSVPQLEELAESRRRLMDGLKTELETEKRGRLEGERKVSDIREGLERLRSSVGNTLGTPTPSASHHDWGAMNALEALSLKYQTKFDESKEDRQRVKDGLFFMQASLAKFKSDLKARRNAKKSQISEDAEPPILEKEVPVPAPPTTSTSPVASTSAGALFQPMDVDDDEVESAPAVLTKQVPARSYPQGKSRNVVRGIKLIKNFTCHNCDSRFHTLAGLRHHLAGQHKEVLPADQNAGCMDCGKTFTSVAECMKHGYQYSLRTRHN